MPYWLASFFLRLDFPALWQMEIEDKQSAWISKLDRQKYTPNMVYNLKKKRFTAPPAAAPSAGAFL
jgi:hypothetical protein